MSPDFLDAFGGLDGNLDPGDILSLVTALVKALVVVGNLINFAVRGREAKQELYSDARGYSVSPSSPSKTPGTSTREDHLAFDQVASAIGQHQSHAVREMDDNLKIAVAGAARGLRRVPREMMTWAEIMRVFTQSPLLEQAERFDGAIDRAETFERAHPAWFSRQAAVLPEVHAWFARLVTDEDIARARQTIDVNAIAGVVAHTASWFSRFVGSNEIKQKTLLDVGIVRYPDRDHPYIKVYRIELVAWSSLNSAGISGQFNARKFLPRLEVIGMLSNAARCKALEEANAVLRGPGC